MPYKLSVKIGLVLALFLLAGCAGQPGGSENDAAIGFIGCSATHNVVDGYRSLGGEKFWVIERGEDNFGGGSLFKWERQLANSPRPDEKDYWGIFQGYLDEHPDTGIIWWEPCSSREVGLITYENMVSVLDEIKRRAPGAEVYVSPFPVFPGSGDLMCNADDGPAVLKGFVERLVQEGRAKAGPELTPLEENQVTSDGCHANDEGKAVWGRDLTDFFG